MENSKLFDMMEKMYSEMQTMKSELRSEMQSMKSELRSEMQSMKVELTQNLVRIENKMDDNNKALYDGYTQTYEGICEIRENLEVLTDRVENQEIKLQILKAVK